MISPDEPKLQRRIAWLLTAQTIILIGGSLNRLSGWFQAPVAPNRFLRWVEFNHLLVFPPLTILAAIGIRQTLLKVRGNRKGWIDLLFVMAVYLLGVGYGVHEITNYLSSFLKAKDAIDPVVREIIRFNDDDFSHWVFFGAYLGLNFVTLLWQRANPFESSLKWGTLAICLINALILSTAIFVNLSRGTIGFDLVAILVLAVGVLIFWIGDRKQPIHLYYLFGLWPGLIATAVFRAITK